MAATVVAAATAAAAATADPTDDDTMISRIGYFGLREFGDEFQLYPCFEDDKLFQQDMRGRLAEADVKDQEDQMFRRNRKSEIDEIAKLLHFDVVTDILHDDLLVLKSRDYTYLYFGVLTTNGLYVACWLLKPTMYTNIGEGTPRICFWMLSQQYLQLLVALGVQKGTQLDDDKVKACLDVSDKLLKYEHKDP
jgi:hypothetical protein